MGKQGKIIDLRTYQEIPGTGHFEPSLGEVALCDAKTGRRRVKTTFAREKRDGRRARANAGMRRGSRAWV